MIEFWPYQPGYPLPVTRRHCG